MGSNAADNVRKQTGPWSLRRLHWSLLSFGGGVAVYYIFFKILVDPLNPTMGALDGLSYQFLWEGEAPGSRETIVAADLEARYKAAVPSVLMLLSFLAAVFVAFGYILPRFGRWTMILGAVTLPFGAIIGFSEQHNNPLRRAVADCRPGTDIDFCPLDQAVIRSFDGASFTAETLAQIQFLIHCNSVVGTAAIFLLGVCFFFIARAANESELDCANLLFRRRALEAILVVSGLVLVFSVATTHGFYQLSSALMQPASGKPIAKLASAGSTYWGAIFTTVLLVAAVPAILSIVSDSLRASWTVLPEASFEERQKWREKQGLNLELKHAIAVAVTGFAPVLTAPSLDIIQALTGVG